MIEDQRIIDFHGHTGRHDCYNWNDDPKAILHAMDKAGVDVACLFNIFHPDGTTGNDITARFVAAHPDRFVGFAYVSPTMPEGMAAELTRAIDELGLVAIKLYPPFTKWDLHEPIWHPIYEFADERGLAVIFHTGTDPHSHPSLLADCAAQFPNANFVAGHAGNVAEPRAAAIKVAQTYPNVYLETCSTFRTPGVIEQLVNEAGADRVLFGSDISLMDPRPQLGKVITADISVEAKRLVCGGNAARLLGI